MCDAGNQSYQATRFADTAGGIRSVQLRQYGLETIVIRKKPGVIQNGIDKLTSHIEKNSIKQ
jgi:hypothetical protein